MPSPMPSPPRISVVMPCRNARRTIERALDSIQMQDWPAEVIVVDACSTDGTVDILERRHDIRYVSEPDQGLSDAVNKGARMATGEVLGWLNADDAYTPGALRRAAEAFAETPTAEWLVGRCTIVDGSGREIRHAVTRYKNWLLDHYSLPLHLTQNFVPAPSTFFRRDTYLELGGLEIEWRYAMDYDLFLRLGQRSAPILLRDVLALFTMEAGTLSMTGFERQFAEHEEIAWRHRSRSLPAALINKISSRAIVSSYRVARHQRERRLSSS